MDSHTDSFSIDQNPTPLHSGDAEFIVKRSQFLCP